MKILSIAPTRIGLFGGGTDVEPYATSYGGLCISMAISIRQHLYLLSDNDIFERPKNVFPHRANPEFYYAFLKEFGINGGHASRIISTFDGVIESGLGSSAAAAVALVGAINRRLNKAMTLAVIAEKARKIEINRLGLFGGRQDQYAAVFGGVNYFEFNKNGVRVTSLKRGFIEKIYPFIILFYSGFNRQNPKIQEGLKELTDDKKKALDGIKKIALRAVEPIVQGNALAVGHLLRESWELKKQTNKGVSTKQIDEIFEVALKNGAFGGKVMGAGGGGYLFFLCSPDKRRKLIAALKETGVNWVDFCVDWNGLEVKEVEWLV